MQERICAVDGCQFSIRRGLTRGWCHTHYVRWWKHGDPGGPEPIKALARPQEKAAWLAALVAEVDGDGCRDWPWGVSAQGYPRLRRNGVLLMVPHLVMELDGRPRPTAPGNVSLHACDRRVCVAPWHLRWGTQAENVADMMSRGRHA